ncbi:hypothetical protein AHF37_04760 [Paragonimus kellicotti]|nr:hypothetical protein AHF37_04760 [Paragonimus kellicotti]
MSSGVLQEAIDKVIDGFDAVLTHQYDTITFGTTKQKHDYHRRKLLGIFAVKYGVVKPSNCAFVIIELEFFTFAMDTDEPQLDPSPFISLSDIQLAVGHEHLRSIVDCS